jgi:4'-phosphopantetheinyl transferase
MPLRVVPLQPGQISIWWIPVLGTEEVLAGGILSDAEQRRARRLIFQRDRAQFVACRRALRHLLGRYAGYPPQSIAFEYASHGKPALVREQNALGLEFSVSHAPGAGVIALAVDRPVGVDIERVRDNPWAPAIAARHFSRAERARLARICPAGWARAFCRIWTRKEAVLKVSGGGLGGFGGLAGSGLGQDLTLRSLRLPSADHVATVAAPGRDWVVTYGETNQTSP